MKKYFILLSALILILFISCKTQVQNNGDENKSTATNPIISTSRAASLDFIFNNQTLGKTTITIKRSQWRKLCEDYRYFFKNENCVQAESYQYEKDGKTWTFNKGIGFRLRGNTSRFCPQGYDNGRVQGQMNKDWSADYYEYAEKQPEGKDGDYRQSHFKVDFEEFLEDGEEQKMSACIKGLALKRLDNWCGKEIFCYDLFHKNGIWTAPRASHTRLIIKIIEDEDDEENAAAEGDEQTQGDQEVTIVDYGVYEMFEEVNKQALKARDKDENKASSAWKNSKGNLWKCCNDLTPDRMYETGIEDIRIIYQGDEIPAGMLTNGREDESRIGYVYNYRSLDLKTNKESFDAAAAELQGFVTELNNLPIPASEEDVQAIATIKAFYEKWFDMDLFLKTYSVSILCGMDDDYWGNANNYYLYFDSGAKGTGKLYFIPFDYDNTLGASIKEGGFTHNPLDWGRGENRPLMDKLLQVPEYKEKFVNYLLEVSSNEYWSFERAGSVFTTWGNMCNFYMQNADVDYHIGAREFADYGSWGPSGYSLLNYDNNVFDYTSYYFRKNLGLDVRDTEIYKREPKELPESEPIEILIQETTGEEGSPDGERVSIAKMMSYPGMADTQWALSVTPKYNGLYIEKSHDSVWTHMSISVYDESDGKENVRIVTDEKHNEFFYPFVQKGHTYRISLAGQDANWGNWRGLYNDEENGQSLKTEALGGLGNYRVTYDKWDYDSPSYSITLEGLVYEHPLIEEEKLRVEAAIYDDGVWSGRSSYPGSIPFVNSTADLGSASSFLYKKDRLFIVLTLKFSYNENDYEFTVFENDNNSLIKDLHE